MLPSASAHKHKMKDLEKQEQDRVQRKKKQEEQEQYDKMLLVIPEITKQLVSHTFSPDTITETLTDRSKIKPSL